MTGANGGADPGVLPGWRWDVALSFAGAQRGYVEQVAGALKAQGVRCFYDADEQIELWGKYLAEELPAIYGEQAAAVVVFVSAEYAARDWTRLERRAALARAVRERQEYVLPARFDDTPLPGLLSDMVTVDLRTRTPEQFAAMIAESWPPWLSPDRRRRPIRETPPRPSSRRLRRERCGRARLTRGGWACMRRSACQGCPTRCRRSTCRGMWMPPSSVFGPRWRLRRCGADWCCWSAGPR
jgi:TIR domain